jgi:hypothetical protein
LVTFERVMRATVERFDTQIACLGSKSGPGFGSFELEIFELSPLGSAAENEGEKEKRGRGGRTRKRYGGVPSLFRRPSG